MSLALDIIDKAKQSGKLIATAESCTGGLIAAAITDIPGSSAVLDCGFVTYSNHAKRTMLGVLAQTLEEHGAVSEEVAAEMAQGALRHSKAGLSVSATGIAGPGGSDHKPEGRVCFGIMQAGQAPETQTVEFGPLGRENVRNAARDHALRLLLAALS